MKNQINIALKLFVLMTILTGILYPLLITGISTALFREKAGGSLVIDKGIIMGSALIGQANNNPAYFWPRPSATNYNPLPSGGTNYSWTDHRLKDLVAERKETFLKDNMLQDSARVPVEMLYASASGLDPQISPRAAVLQEERIARTRNFNEDQRKKLSELVVKMTEKPQFSLFGEQRINVFLLNLELDKIK
jgi:K+-transporting ATPase ATPase C chain